MKFHKPTDFNSVSVFGNMLKDRTHLGIDFYNEDENGNYFGKDFTARLSIRVVCSLCAMLLHYISEFEKDDANACATYKNAIDALDNCRENKNKIKD